MGGKVTHVTSSEQFNEIIAKDRVAVFDFWATWCGPCRMMSPIFEKLSEEFGETVDFYKVDADEQPDISQELGIRALPTFVAFKDGKKIKEVVSANPAALQDMIKTAAA